MLEIYWSLKANQYKKNVSLHNLQAWVFIIRNNQSSWKKWLFLGQYSHKQILFDYFLCDWTLNGCF